MRRCAAPEIDPMNSPHVFSEFYEWRDAITGRCGLELTAAYCKERIQALMDSSVPSTKNFVETYGAEYLQCVIAWFRRAGEEAGS
jgi:hypothetical protein